MARVIRAGNDHELWGSPQSIWDQSEIPKGSFGKRLTLEDGRVFRYARNGATALVAGKLCQSAVNGGQTTVQKNLTVVTAEGVGGYTVKVTATTDTVVADNFKDGFLTIYDGSAAQGVGQVYRVKSNTVATAGGTFTVTLYEPLKISVSSSAKAALNKHPYDSVVVSPVTTSTGIPVGVPIIAVSINQYFWLQTWGPCCVLADGTWTYGADLLVSNSGTVTGALEIDDAAKAQCRVGYSMNDAADTKYGCVYLQIAP